MQLLVSVPKHLFITVNLGYSDTILFVAITLDIAIGFRCKTESSYNFTDILATTNIANFYQIFSGHRYNRGVFYIKYY